MIDRDTLIEKSYELEPLSPTVVRLASLVTDVEADIADVVDVVGKDPALAGSILRVANSSRYGGHVEISTVSDAVVRVGPSVVLQLATRASVRRVFDELVPSSFSDNVFWFHSWAASTAAERSRRQLGGGKVPPEAPTAALLHDIGKLTFAQALSSDEMRRIDAAIKNEHELGPDAERALLGIDHAELGGLIAAHWSLPESIHTAITHHHQPEAVELPVADAVHLADVVAVRALGTPAGTGQEYEVRDAVRARLGITDEHFDALCGAVSAELCDSGAAAD